MAGIDSFPCQEISTKISGYDKGAHATDPTESALHQRKKYDTPAPKSWSEMMTQSILESVRENMITIKCMSISGNFFTDQTGQFPNKSSRGNHYIMVLYNHDSNAILAEPIKTRAAEELLRAIKVIPTHLRDQGLHPALQILDKKSQHWLSNSSDKNK